MRGALRFAVVLWRGFARSPLSGRDWPSASGGAERLRAPSIWLHAVSLGEMSAAAPLGARLRLRLPEIPLLLTTATPAGRARARRIVRRERADMRYPAVRHSGFGAGAFWRAPARGSPSSWKRSCGRIYYASANGDGIPVFAGQCPALREIGGALSALRRAVRGVFSTNLLVAAQSAEDAERFQSIGAAPREFSWPAM